MANITFIEGSGLQDSIFGKSQMPIRMFLEKRGEAFEQESIIKHLFKMEKSNGFGEKLTTMTAMNGFQAVGENGAYPTDGMQEGYQKLLVYETWKDSFSVSQEMIEDGKLLDMKRQPDAFMTSYHRTREMFGAALYAGAFNGKTHVDFRGRKFDITGADGVTVFHTGHKPKVKGANQSNMFADEFSADALGRAESAMHLFKGDDDNILDVAPTVILIPEDADMKKKVFAAIGADKDPVTANNAFNYQYGRWTVICWSYLNQFLKSGLRPWMLLDPAYNETYGGAVWNDRVKLNVTSSIDPNTDANVWRGRSRFNAGFNDWRFGCVGGIPGGTELSTLSL